MNKEELSFQIDQLRKDKILYSVELVAVVGIATFGFMFAKEYFPSGLKDTTNTLLISAVIGYGVFVLVGNITRWRKIKSLQKQL